MQHAETHRVAVFSVRVLPGGRGFVLESADTDRKAIRLEFPPWALHQLMRVMPHLDAALHDTEAAAIDASALLAYPVIEWTIGLTGPAGGVALRLRNDRHVDAGFYFALQAAIAFQRELGEAIARVQDNRALRELPPRLN